MKIRVYPPHFSGSITIPPSKSHTLRALLCASLAEGQSRIEAPLLSADTLTAYKVLQMLGVQITRMPETETTPETLTVELSRRKKTLPVTPSLPEIPLDLGNSGSLLYFLGVLLTAFGKPFCLTGDSSLNNRPVEPLLAIYRQAGLSFSCNRTAENAAVPPLHVSGQLPAKNYVLHGPFSQPVTGLLYAAPLLDGTTHIEVKNAGETPYLRMTASWLKTAGIKVESAADCSSFRIEGNQTYRPFSAKITGDWSSAAFPLAAALVCNARVRLNNLDPNDVQGDSRILSIVKEMGVRFTVSAAEHTVFLEPSAGCLHGGMFACGDIPDAVPALAAIACFAQGKTTLTDIEVCRFKECDRLHAVAVQLKAFGAKVVEGKDFLCIEGGSKLHPAKVHSQHDHRIAMMLAVVACGISAQFPSGKTSCIEDFDCVSVSYPSFLADFAAFGADFKQS